MAIRPLPYFVALAINSLTINPSGIAVRPQIEFNDLDEDLLRALIRRQHRREVAAEVLKEFFEIDRLHRRRNEVGGVYALSIETRLAATASCAARSFRVRLCPALQRKQTDDHLRISRTD